MKLPLVGVSLAVCLLSAGAWAQSSPSNAPPSPNQSTPATVLSHSTPVLNAIRAASSKGLYQEMVDKASAALEKADKPDPEILYWRGFAYRHLNLYDEARADLAPLGSVTGWKTFPTAASLTEELDALIALRPPNEYDIHDGDSTIFRVYYENQSPFVQSVISALPKGYNAASTFTGGHTENVPVFIFEANRYDRFAQMMFVTTKKPPRFWWRVLSQEHAIFVSQRNQNGEVFAPDYPGMPLLFSHEMTHVLVREIVGTSKDFPNWFSEGGARCGEAVYSPGMRPQNDLTIQQLLHKNGILPPDQLTTSDGFQGAVDQQKGAGQVSDAYAQGFNMTRYLGVLLKGESMGDFLDDMRDKGGFTPALKDKTGLTPDEFYHSWLAAISGTN